jgi:hypothetical protein
VGHLERIGLGFFAVTMKLVVVVMVLLLIVLVAVVVAMQVSRPIEFADDGLLGAIREVEHRVRGRLVGGSTLAHPRHPVPSLLACADFQSFIGSLCNTQPRPKARHGTARHDTTRHEEVSARMVALCGNGL